MAVLTGAIFLFLAAFNAWSMLVQRSKPGEPHVSPAPLVGGVLGFFAVLIAPVGGFFQRLLFAGLPLLLDLGCGLYFISYVFCVIKEKKQGTPNQEIDGTQ